MKKIGIVILAGAALAGCSTAEMVRQPQSVQGVWLRSDGRSAKNDPQMTAQFEAAKAECSTAGGEPDRICMDHRGYVLVPQNEVEAAAAKLRAAHGIN